MKHVLELPEKIIAEWGSIQLLGSETANHGSKAALIYSKRLQGSALISQSVSQLERHGVQVLQLPVASGEPTVHRVEELVRSLEEGTADVVIGVGGGSIMDAAKAAAGITYPGRCTVLEHFQGAALEKQGLPWIAVPTTSGSGAEATPNAVLSDGGSQKQSIRGDRGWLAKTVLLDPELTVSNPKEVTVWSGLDALTQAIEAHVSKGAGPLTEPYSLRAAQLIAGSLEKAAEEPHHQAARTDMAYGSLLAGMALANARLGVVHGLAHPLGILYNIPHGLVCGMLLPWSIKYNMPVSGSKYEELARAMRVGESAEDLIEWVYSLHAKFNIPASFKSFGLDRSHVEQIVRDSMPSGSLKANPRTVEPGDLVQLLEEQLQL